ncbi:SSU ribosomal protein S3P [Thalassoporum mexicanum PCC 7367]|uniref:30S ribosomal protein S3 n=1 Tax=Thalassoporum mexicanum TaxID=3457544 RepID=UPI00029FB388|nr:30S ribosomal protein S3 [Pseudanabaena sp. PCC 7367]AFY69382.1 SSU ribosomal protein S3P [Pseudanabaena sp. PCC 7367]
MGQKVHPNGLRVGVIRPHLSRWFADGDRYPILASEDFEIRKYITKTLDNAGVADVRIERKADQVDIEIRTARPGVVVGRGGSGIDQLRQGLLKHLGKVGTKEKTGTSQIRINVVEVARVDAEAALIGEYIAQQIERRVSFRRVVRQAIQRAQRAGVEGIKVQVGGRLNGAEIARTEWVREGRVPLHTIRADIDYAYRTASTVYGIIGVKVWIFKGEIEPGQEAAAPAQPQPRRRQQQRRRPQFEDRSGAEG